MAFGAIRLWLRTILVAATAVLATAPVIASPILTGTASTLPDDSYLYSYELTNPATELENIFDLGLFLDGEPLDVSSPPGWDFIAGLGFINWFSMTLETDILAGQTLSGFSFRSLLGPGTIEFETLGANADTGDVGEPFRSTVVGPVSSSVPEPGTMALMTFGLSALLFRRRTRPDVAVNKRKDARGSTGLTG